MMMVMVVVTMHSRTDAEINARAMMVVMVMMMVTDHNLSSLRGAALGQTLIVGFQQRQGVRDGIEKLAIAGGLRELRAARRRRLGGGHGGEGRGRSQQPS